MGEHKPLAWSWFLPPTDHTVRLVCGNIFKRDAVGNFCFDIYNLCQQNNIPIEMYAYSFTPVDGYVIKQEEEVLTDANEHDTLLYFHSIYDPHIEKIAKLHVKKKIAYFHGITDPKFFRDNNQELSEQCDSGFKQLSLLSHFDVFAANSKATAARWALQTEEIYSRGISVIPPKLSVNKTAATLLSKKDKKNTQLLYVGRMVSHKKIEDLLVFFSQYLAKDPEAELTLVGKCDNQAYMDYLTSIQEKQLGVHKNKVHWLGSVSDEELQCLYQSASAYLSMSEDEGFCLPLLEAMQMGVPVFAYGIPAVKEVLNKTGMYFSHKNFKLLADTLHQILRDEKRLQAMIENQHTQANHLLTKMDGQAILQLLES